MLLVLFTGCLGSKEGREGDGREGEGRGNNAPLVWFAGERRQNKNNPLQNFEPNKKKFIKIPPLPPFSPNQTLFH